MSANWVRTFAAWAPVHIDAPDTDAVHVTRGDLYCRLWSYLDEAGAEPVAPFSLSISTSHNFGPDFPVNVAAVRAETRAIVLRNPNPFPPMRVFGGVRS